MDQLTPTDKVELAFEILVYIIGTIGNIFVIFMIIYLGDTKKITHWYVLQLAIADLLYLQTLPVRMIETINHLEWLYSEGSCIAKHVVIYVNYYGSMIFLTVMAIDRYMAVCHGLSKVTQKLRSQRPCYVITIFAWIMALLLCIPVIMYSGVFENGDKCTCGFTFPTDGNIWCREFGYEETKIQECLESDFAEFVLNIPNKCVGESEPDDDGSGSSSGSSGYGFDSDTYIDSGYPDYGAPPENINQSDNLGSAPDSITENKRSYCSQDHRKPAMHTFIILNFTVMFLVPLLIISICYGLIVMRLRKFSARTRSYSERSENSYSGTEMTRRGVESTRRKQSTSGGGGRHKLKVTVMCAVLVILFVVCWLPFHAHQLAMIKGFWTTKGSCGIFSAATVILTFINSALNPYLYNFLGTFSKRLRDIKKHQRTRSIVESLRWAGNGRRSRSNSSVPSETNVTRRTEFHDASKITKEEIPLRQM